MGGSRLQATGRCIFAMKVGRKMTFNQYWNNPDYRVKIPIRNGSRRLQVGDNIYHHNGDADEWLQEDSHHSYPDGSPNLHNTINDTQSDAVLISDVFFYFGKDAVTIPQELLDGLGYKNPRSHRRFSPSEPVNSVIRWFEINYRKQTNQVFADPFDFDYTGARYSAHTNKITK